MKRLLSFNVEEQKLTKDPSCSFDGIVSGTRKYLVSRFSFNSAWKGYICVAVFKKLLDEYPVALKNGECLVPDEVLDWDYFSVRIVGRAKDGSQITTNEVTINQIRGGNM